MGLARRCIAWYRGVGCTLHHPSILLVNQNIKRMQSLDIRTQSQFIKNQPRNILDMIISPRF